MSIENKIREFGQKREIEELQNYVKTLDFEEVINLMKTKIKSPNVAPLWNYILQSFTNTPEYHTQRLRISLVVLKEIDNNPLPTSIVNEILNDLCVELPNYKQDHLITICTYCLESIQSRNSNRTSFKYVIPELLNILGEMSTVEYNGVDLTGGEFKNKLIDSLCVIQWEPEIVTSLASMFNDISLSKEEHLTVTTKLVQNFEKMTPQEIPGLVHEMLKLCKTNSRLLILYLQNYFDLRIYDRINSREESFDFNIIEDSSRQETLDAESTILYHIYQSLEYQFIKDYLASLKNVLRSPEFILHPFQLTVLLTLSTSLYYEDKVFEIVRSCVSKTLHEDQKKNASLWFQNMVPKTRKIENVFQQIIDISLEERDLVRKGLTNFGFILLGVGAMLGRDKIAEKQWELGTMVVMKIIKKKRSMISVILEMLYNRISVEQHISQYIECLYILSKNPLLMLENHIIVTKLIDCLLQVPSESSSQLLDAIVPITKVSPILRDHLILLLRKALYSRSTDTRQTAVIGFLKLLTNLKISNLLALTQSSSSSSNSTFSSGHSIFTQISVNRSQSTQSIFSNEALCLEVLSILSRCFMQQIEVKNELYEGLYAAVCFNPELGIPVLDTIWTHFIKYYEADPETLPPLKFDDITVTKSTTVTLQESIGKLTYTIGLIITKVKECNENNDTVFKFQELLDSLCRRMTNCEVFNFEIDDGTDLLDILPESQRKSFILKGAMQVYEALIGYKICCWNTEFKNTANEINNLYQGYSRLLQFSKTLSKSKKVENRKKSSQSNISQKKDSGTKKHFKLPETVLDYQVLIKILSLLHNLTVPFTNTEESKILKVKKDFHFHIMQATNQFITNLKNKKTIDVQIVKQNFEQLVEIAQILYERIIERFEEFVDFDCSTAVVAIDTFLLILTTIFHQFQNNITLFLTKISGRNKEEGLTNTLGNFIEIYKKLMEIDYEEVYEDPEVKKIPQIVVNTLTLLVQQIPNDDKLLSIELIDWFENFAKNRAISNKTVVTTLINLMLETNARFKTSLTVLERMTLASSKITGVIEEEDEEQSEEFKIINEYTVQNVMHSICTNIKSQLDDIDWIIVRLKSEYNLMGISNDVTLERKKEDFKERERNICGRLCFISNILTQLCNCTIQPGNVLEAIIKNLSLFYSTMGLLAKHFIFRSTKTNPIFQQARFEKLVKSIGKQLTPMVYKLILFIDESQKQSTQSTQSKKKSVDGNILKSKVLKETRSIPKMIYEIEQFSKFLMQLSNKTKIDLNRYLGTGKVRDFRIMDLKQVLEYNESTQRSQNSENSTDLDEATPSPSKRARK